MGVSDLGLDTVGACNVYQRPALPGGAFDMAEGAAAHPASWYFGCQGSTDPAAAHKVDCKWPGQNRRENTTSRDAVPLVAPDLVGVWIELYHPFPVRLPLSGITLHQTTVALIEPREYSLT